MGTQLVFTKKGDSLELQNGGNHSRPNKTTNRSHKGKSAVRKKYATTSKKRKRRRRLSLVAVLIGITLLLFGGVYAFIGAPVLRIRASVNALQSHLSNLSRDISNKDISQLDNHFDAVQAELQSISNDIESLSFLESFGPLQGYYHNLAQIQSITEKGSELADTILPDLKQTLEASGFRVDTTTDTTQNETPSLTLILRELPLYIDLYTSIEPQLYAIFDDILALDPAYIPKIGSADYRNTIVELQQFIEQYPAISEQAIDFLAYAPELLGAEEPTTYLLILQNEAEMRASGGLLTAYGTVSVAQGEIQDDIELTDMWNLENYITSTIGVNVGYQNIYGQLFLMLNGCGGTVLRAQDAGIYPDLYWTMDTFTDYYETANNFNPSLFPDYDHVIVLNNAFAERMLSLIQPLEVEGFGSVTADNLFEFIKEETDRPELSFDPERKAIIGDIATAAKEKFTNLGVDALPQVIDAFITAVYSKEVAFYSPDIGLQNHFDTYGMSGRIATDVESDYFHLNEAQNCSLKLNKFIRNTVDLTIKIADDGSITNNASMYWENPQVYDESLKLQYDTTGKFTYRAWVRLFTPEGSDIVYSDGLRASNVFPYRPQDYFDEEVQKQISDNVIQFNHIRLTEDAPIKSQTLEVQYELPGRLDYSPAEGYQLLIQKHPGKVWDEPYAVTIFHGDITKSINLKLDRDKLLTYREGVVTVEDAQNELDWMYDIIDLVE